jgi:hypothetical protein
MGENPNNNADFDQALESVMVPAKRLTLGEFVDEVQNLAESMLEEMESDSTPKTWDDWLEILTAAHLAS